MTPRDIEGEARARARAKYGFYKHLTVFFGVNLMLFFINLVTSPGYWWCIWPLFGWGVAIVIHALKAFVLDGRNAIVDRLTEQELHKARRDRH